MTRPTDYQIHDALPSGFSYADAWQAEQYTQLGVIYGASKVVYVRAGDGVDIAVRLHPPKSFPALAGRRALIGMAADDAGAIDPDEALRWYIRQYKAGHEAARRSSRAFGSGLTSAAWDDGYLDQRAGRPKWHLAHCVDHDECGEG